MDNKDLYRVLGLNDRALSSLKGQTIADIEYQPSSDGDNETIRIVLSNGYTLVIDSVDQGTENCSNLNVCITKDN